MSRRRKAETRRVSRASPRGRRGRTPAFAIAALATAGLLAGLWLRFRPAHRDAGGETASLGPVGEAYERALRVSMSGHHVESLPDYALAARTMDGVWVYHFNYSSALYNATLQPTSRFGAALPAIRSSVERVALVAHSMDEIAAARRLVRSASDSARVFMVSAQMLQIWGLPWDALGPLEQAHRLDPTIERGMAAAHRQRMEHPAP